jgi:hypothetical protein
MLNSEKLNYELTNPYFWDKNRIVMYTSKGPIREKITHHSHLIKEELVICFPR